MGQAINQYFESIMASVIWENGLGNILGRDVMTFTLGFCVCLVLWAIFDGKEIGHDKRRNEN